MSFAEIGPGHGRKLKFRVLLSPDKLQFQKKWMNFPEIANKD